MASADSTRRDNPWSLTAFAVGAALTGLLSAGWVVVQGQEVAPGGAGVSTAPVRGIQELLDPVGTPVVMDAAGPEEFGTSALELAGLTDVG